MLRPSGRTLRPRAPGSTRTAQIFSGGGALDTVDVTTDGTHTATAQGGDPPPIWPTLGDFDADGWTDVAVTSLEGGAWNTISVLRPGGPSQRRAPIR